MGRHLKDPGTLVGAEEKTLLAEINQIDPIYVYFPINEQDLLRVRGVHPKPGDKVEREKHPVYVGLANETGYPHQGYLDFTGISLSPTTGSLMLRAILPNPDTVILPGLFARVRAPIGDDEEALLVPDAAVSYDQVGPFVRVVTDKNVVERREVKLGVQEGANRVISEGLNGEDWVVVAGLLRAVPGRTVVPEKNAAQPGSEGVEAPGPDPASGKTAP